MKAVALTILGLFLLVPLASANHSQDPQENGTMVAFDHVGGNEWWVEVKVSGDQPFDAVGARDEGGQWVGLAENDWGVWAGSFHIEPGHKVQFQAVDTPHAGEKTTSCWFTHPGGIEQCDTDGETPASVFDHKGSNEWWVQVGVSGMPQRVQAQDTGGAWNELQFKDWGDWAASFHIEPGHDVRFRAMVDGTWQKSCWFTHPGGKTPDGGETCSTGGEEPPQPPPSGDFDATFGTSGGNEWWVEVYVDANEPLAAVHARDDGGAWIALEKKSWGSWAKSFHIQDGSLVDFRATSTDGAADISGTYRWPAGTQVTPEPDGDDPPPPTTTDVAFGPKAGNEWWIETLAVGDGEPIDRVEARAGDGAWHELSHRDWGAWAASFHVPAGEDVTFRATTATGTDTSDAFHWPDATLVGGDGSWPEEGSYVMTNTLYRNPAPEVHDKDHTTVYHDGVWWRHSVGYEEDPGSRQETESWGEGSVRYHPTDVAVGDTYEHGSKTVTVTGTSTYEARQEGDAVTVLVYKGTWTADCGCDYDLYEWDRDLGLEVFFYNGGTEIWGKRLLDTDAPMATV